MKVKKQTKQAKNTCDKSQAAAVNGSSPAGWFYCVGDSPSLIQLMCLFINPIRIHMNNTCPPLYHHLSPAADQWAGDLAERLIKSKPRTHADLQHQSPSASGAGAGQPEGQVNVTLYLHFITLFVSVVMSHVVFALRQAPGSQRNQETPRWGGEAPETPDVLSLWEQQSCEKTHSFYSHRLFILFEWSYCHTHIINYHNIIIIIIINTHLMIRWTRIFIVFIKFISYLM